MEPRKTGSRLVMLPLGMGIGALCLHFATREAVPESGFAAVTKGTSQARVRHLLGTPQAVRRAPDHSTFAYGGLGRLRWCTMEVRFDASGRVESKFHDH